MLKNFIIVAIAAFVLSSCAHTIYPVESMYNNYQSQMRSVDELEIKSKVQIYFNEKDIKSDYTVISANSYKPFCIIPLKFVQDKAQIKKFLVAAVKKAHEQGGNAILVRTVGIISYYYVLNLTNWNADDVPAALFANPIFKMDKANEVKSGALASMKRSERVRHEKAFINEIESNVENLYELAEVEAVREKIQILSDYNLTLKNPQKSIDKVVKKSLKKCKMKETPIIKRTKKQAQATA